MNIMTYLFLKQNNLMIIKVYFFFTTWKASKLS